jgi:hypothetical protein
MEFRVKQIKSYHIIGNLVNDRKLINEKVRSASINFGVKEMKKSRLDSLKEEN